MSEVEQAGSEAVSRDVKVIKRYTNRKLYDTVESRYVTLDEIAEMIKAGGEVQIIDNRSKEDLTSVTLAQIIFEEEKKKNRMPLNLLREIIRRPGESLQGFIQKELQPRVASIREEAESKLDWLLRRDERREDGPGDPGTDVLKASQRVLEEWQRRIDDRVRIVMDNVVGNLPALGADVQSLLQRIEELEKRLAEVERPAAPTPEPTPPASS